MMATHRRATRAIKLSELAVRKARPAKAAYLIWGIAQRGLALQVQPTGAKAWKCIYSRSGRPRWLHLGRTDAIALGDARALAAEAMLKVIKGDGGKFARFERSTLARAPWPGFIGVKNNLALKLSDARGS